MQNTQFLQLREVEHHITLVGLIHAYSKVTIAEVMSPKLIVVGITTLTAEAFVRDVLRSSKIPPNIVTVGIDTVKTDLVPCAHVEYCFFLPDLAVVEQKIFYDILVLINHGTTPDRVKFMLGGKIAPRFHTAKYTMWLNSLMRTQVGEFDTGALTDMKGAFLKLDFNEVALKGEVPDADFEDTIFLDQRFAELHAVRLNALLAKNLKCKYLIHPSVARVLFTYETYGTAEHIIL